jgi:hypothetical protein
MIFTKDWLALIEKWIGVVHGGLIANFIAGHSEDNELSVQRHQSISTRGRFAESCNFRSGTD